MSDLDLQLAIQRKGDDLLVDARLLHQQLEITTKFADWITRRLADALAVENQDFFSELRRSVANRQTTEYILTLDLAKELAMLERSERGREIRRYFINAEKQLRAQSLPLALPQNLPDALRLAADLAEERDRAQAQVATLAPKADVYDALISSEGTYSVAEAAKIIGTGELRLFETLRERGILMTGARSGVEHHNVPYQQYLERGYFEMITRSRPGGEGKPDRISYTTRVTARGLAWLKKGIAQQNLQLGQPA